jgi:hypothetical protein
VETNLLESNSSSYILILAELAGLALGLALLVGVAAAAAVALVR